MENNLQKVTQIFRNVLNVNTLELKTTDTPHTIDGWDSLTHSRLIADIEDAFSIEFKLKELAGIRSIGDIITFIELKQNPS